MTAHTNDRTRDDFTLKLKNFASPRVCSYKRSHVTAYYDERSCNVVNGARLSKVAKRYTPYLLARTGKEQEAVVGVQDKVLAGLRGLLHTLTPDLFRPIREALLSLVVQPGFTKKVCSLYCVLFK